jgi:glycosyltransferase involved in cell wall biosynthesis
LSLDATPINYDELADWYGDKVHPRLVEEAKRTIHRSVMRAAKWYTTWSDWAKSSLVSDYGVPAEKITVLHPGTVLTNFPDPASRAPRHEGPLKVLFVGGDFRRKGGDLLLEVAKSLGPKLELNLVTTADVAAGPGVNVFRGLKPHSPELLKLYAEADVFALPTRGDCLAVVLGEAMASSLPIITTRVGAHAEAVEDGQSGFVIEKDDAAALARHLGRLADDRALVEQMGRRSRAIGEERFNMQTNAHRIADRLLELCSS